jgi:hypothetical protein
MLGELDTHEISYRYVRLSDESSRIGKNRGDSTGKGL